MSFSTPLHGVSSQRQALFEDWLQSRGTLPRREPQLDAMGLGFQSLAGC